MPIDVAAGPVTAARKQPGPSRLLPSKSAIVARLLLAIPGGYGLAAAISICLPGWLPLPPAEAILTSMMLSFPLCCAFVIWCFAAATASRAWLGFGVLLLSMIGLAAVTPKVAVVACAVGAGKGACIAP